MFRSLLAAIAVAISTLTPAHATTEPGGLTLIADSIGSSTVDGAWTGVVADAEGLELRRHVSSGAGFLMRGDGCASGTFSSQLGAVAAERPSMVVVADAIGNSQRCYKGKRVGSSYSQVKRATDAFMRSLAVESSRVGLDRDRVVIVVPTSHKVKKYDWTRDIVARAAARHRFTFVEPYLTVNQTTDGIHPNAAGHRVLADAVLAAG